MSSSSSSSGVVRSQLLVSAANAEWSNPIKSQGAISPEGLVGSCLDLMGPVEVGETTLEELLAQAGQGGEVRWDTQQDVEGSARRVSEMLQLIAASREYQFA